MKQKKIILLYVLVAALATSSCSKWLEVQPKTQIETGQLFSSEKGFQDAMYGVYTNMAGSEQYGDLLTMSFLDVLAQRYDCSANEHRYTQASVYNYQDAGNRERIANIWGSMYHSITDLNNILLHIDEKKNLFQSGNYELTKGEALGLRAFLHFDLLRLFGPSYISGPNKAAIPYVTTVSGGVTRLHTVNGILDTVITELQAAAALLSGYKSINYNYGDPENQLQNSWLNRRQNHFNYWAAKATLARAYLYKGDKQNARIQATEVIESGLFPFQTPDRITDMQDKTFIPEQIFALSKFDLLTQVADYFQASGNANFVSKGRLTNTWGGGGVVDQLYDLQSGGVTDIRYSRLWELSGSVYFSSKFWQNSSNAYFKNIIPLVRIPEMYYIAAECSDVSTAIGYLNTVRDKRGLPALEDMPDAASVQAEIFKEYQKEFYAEGQLFYYYKRLNMSQIRFTSIPGNDNVYVLPLPDDERLYR